MAKEQLDANPQINAILLLTRDMLRGAFKPGQYGEFVVTGPYKDGHAGRVRVEPGRSFDLTNSLKAG